MVKLYDKGVYLLNGTEIAESIEEAKAKTGKELSQKEASENTMAYRILADHNTSGDMERLQIRFDKLTSHDITFVGIIQTARASGLERFPIPYVLTNCHNSLCAAGRSMRMTTCLDSAVRRNTAASMYRRIRQSSINMPAKCSQAGER